MKIILVATILALFAGFARAGQDSTHYDPLLVRDSVIRKELFPAGFDPLDYGFQKEANYLRYRNVHIETVDPTFYCTSLCRRSKA